MKYRHLLLLGCLLSTMPVLSKDQSQGYFSEDLRDSLEVTNMLDVARQLYRSQRYDSLLSQCESILVRSVEIGFNRGVGEAYFLKARGLNRLGRKNKATEMYEKALEYFEAINDHRRLASTYNNWGLILKATGRFREAIDAGEKALEHAQLAPKSRLSFHILNNLGNSYQSLAQFKNAANKYFEALKVLQNETDSTFKQLLQAEVLINLGLVYFEQKLYSKSREIFDEARLIFETQQKKPQLATVYHNMGVLLTEMQEFQLANNYLIRAYNLYSGLNNNVEQAVCISSTARVLHAQNKYDQAIKKYNLAIRNLEKQQASSYLPSSYLGLGETYLAASDYDNALLALMKGLQIALKSGQKVKELKLYEGLITLYKSIGELEMAIMYYDLHSALSQELNDQQIGRLIGQLELKQLIDKRDLVLESLESQTAMLKFQVNRRNTLLILSVLIIILISISFTLIFRQQRLKAINKSMALEQRILRAQLNPHFIFNALGAIQHYMCHKAPEEASRYLSKFSKLMRAILESSRTTLTTLSTELETMKNYLDLQSLRFTNPFNYSFEIDNRLEPEIIQIPSLIMQPLLENAIEHGLVPKKGGQIKVSIMQINGYMKIVVEDNGVGLENDRMLETHQSLGNVITNERLWLLNRKNKDKIRFKIESRSKNTVGLCGTRASLEIPIK